MRNQTLKKEALIQIEKELISYHAHWIVKNGTGIILCLLLAILFSTSFFDYRQVVYGSAQFKVIEIHGSQVQYYADVLISSKELNLIKTGQNVIIKVENFPVKEFGCVPGKIKNISLIQDVKDSCLVTIELPNGIKTNHNIPLHFKPNLFGKAEIFTNQGNVMFKLLRKLIPSTVKSL